MTATNPVLAGMHFTYPDQIGQRKGEGGRRLKGQRRRSSPGEPLVTVITVCFNSARTLEQCILSVLGQSYPNIEYIVVDAASSDGTKEILDRHAEHIDYFVSEPDRGLYHAMNKGIALASGDYILMLNSDDWYPQLAVSRLVEAQQQSGADFVSALAQHVDEAGRPTQILRSMPYDASVRFRMPLRHETMLVPAAAYNKVGGYDESYRIIADFKLVTTLFDAGLSHHEVPEALMFFRNTGVSSLQKDLLFAERERLIKEQFPFLASEDTKLLRELARVTPQDVERLARTYRAQARFIETLKAYYSDQRQHRRTADWQQHAMHWEPEDKEEDVRPKVSVILPFFKAEKTLHASIQSVLAQTLADIELICVNDESPDGSQAIVDEYRSRDDRVVALFNAKNLGLGASRNHGIRRARGEYIFHLDPDDTLPPDSLEALYTLAIRYGSDMTSGAFMHEQSMFGHSRTKSSRRGLKAGDPHVINTTLREMPSLLRSTEGHWSYLYRSEFAKRVLYPTDLKMGQDSIFIVEALVAAKSVSLTDVVVYHYHANADSAMNTFTFRKFMDALEWRRRAWHVLKDAGLQPIGDRLLQAYWADIFFQNLAATVTREQVAEFFTSFRRAMGEAGIKDRPTCTSAPFLQKLFPLILRGQDEQALALLKENLPAAPPKADKVQQEDPEGLRIATFVSRDSGGAATGTLRRVAALRRHGINAHIHALVVNSQLPYVHRVVPQLPDINNDDPIAVWNEVRLRAVSPVHKVPGYRAAELFSLPDSVIDFRDLRAVFDNADVVHMHWVMGMFDYERAGEVLADKPMTWTLADMNAFTGGCHYSEGCEEFKRECQACPLLGGESDLAHNAWRKKKAAYAELKHLHIICPSRWMADMARASSLLGDKPVHYIPNAFPVEIFRPTNKTVARIKLGLPLSKRLFLFGAENLQNKRKGGEVLVQLFDHLKLAGKLDNIEVVVFGKNAIQLPVRVHSLGHITSDEHLALIYSAVDAFLFPSLEDNAPLTVGEALLCGTPVVAFPVGNVPDLVAHKKTGYIARYMDTPDFALGVEWVLDATPTEALQRSLGCRIDAAGFHNPSLAVRRHLDVYRQAMSTQQSTP